VSVQEFRLQKDKVRIYQLARDLNVDTKELIDLCRQAGFDVKNQLSSPVGASSRNGRLPHPGQDIARHLPCPSHHLDFAAGFQNDRHGKDAAGDGPDKPPAPFYTPRGRQSAFARQACGHLLRV